MAWADWRERVASACDGSHNTIEDIDDGIAEGRYHVLEQPACCYIVSIEPYPGETVCQIWWGAGSLEALVTGLTDVHAWAALNGCTEMLIEGNRAWQRALQHLGYTVWSVTLRRPINGPVH